MKEKYQQLVDNAYVSTSSEINLACKAPAPSNVQPGKKRLVLACALLVVSVLTVICTCVLTAFILNHQWNEKHNIYNTYVQTSSGVTQFMTSSVEQNFVQYYIENQMNENTWILDDFNLNLEIIKSETDDDVVCYVAELNYTEAMTPAVAALNEKPVEKKQFHGIMSPDLYPVSDKSFLGSHGARLCGEGVEVYWLRPIDDVLDINNFHQDLNISSSPVASGGRSGRTKRNIRSCHTSCCWLVCCCDIYHFSWEAVEHFTCKHVCQKCTINYKPKIQKIC